MYVVLGCFAYNVFCFPACLVSREGEGCCVVAEAEVECEGVVVECPPCLGWYVAAEVFYVEIMEGGEGVFGLFVLLAYFVVSVVKLVVFFGGEVVKYVHVCYCIIRVGVGLVFMIVPRVCGLWWRGFRYVGKVCI